MYSSEPFKIVAIIVCASLIGEFLCYVFVFRRSTFKNIKADAITQQTKLDALKSKGPGHDKAIKKLEESMMKVQANLYIFRIQVMTIQWVLLLGTWRMLANSYKGIPVAKLPFEPFKLFAKATHASLEGDDLTDCSYNAMYMLTSMVVRNLTGKFVNREDQEVLTPKTSAFFEKLMEGQKLD